MIDTGNHSNQVKKDLFEYLVFLLDENACDDVERVISGIDTKQVEYPDNSQHTENNESVKKEKRKNGKQIDNSVKGAQKAENCRYSAFFRVQEFGSPYSQRIFYRKDKHRNALADTEKMVMVCHFVE